MDDDNHERKPRLTVEALKGNHWLVFRNPIPEDADKELLLEALEAAQLCEIHYTETVSVASRLDAENWSERDQLQASQTLKELRDLCEDLDNRILCYLEPDPKALSPDTAQDDPGNILKFPSRALQDHALPEPIRALGERILRRLDEPELEPRKFPRPPGAEELPGEPTTKHSSQVEAEKPQDPLDRLIEEQDRLARAKEEPVRAETPKQRDHER